MTEVGTGFVTLVPSMRGFRKAAERGLRDGLRGPARKSGDEAGDEAGKGFSSSFGKALTAKSRGLATGIGRVLTKSFTVAGKTAAVGFGAAFVAQAAVALASGAAKLAHGLAAGAALLPAAALAGALAFGTLKVAVLGVGDALSAGLSGDTEKFNEAIKGMAPPARAFAREVVALKPQLDALKASVQGNFFAPLVDEVGGLASTWLPILGREMTALSGTFGRVAERAADLLQSESVVNALGGALGNASTAVGNLAGALPNLVAAFVPLVAVGSTFLPQLSNGFSGATARLALFMQNAANTGRLAGFIQGGIDKLKSLWATVQQVRGIFSDLGAIGSAVFGGLSISSGGLLDSISGVVARVKEFVTSAEGSKLIGQVFEGISTVMGVLGGKAAFVGRVLGGLFGPIMPKLMSFLRAFGRLADTVSEVGFEALEPVLSGIGSVLSNLVLPPLTTLANWLADNKPVIQGIGIAIMAYLIPGFVVWAASAAAAGLSTLLAAAPLILLGAAIAGLAALVIIHFDTIKKVVSGVFNWVKTNWPLLLAILTGPFGLAVLAITKNWDTIKEAARKAKDWIGNRVEDIVGFFTGMPGKITDAFSSLGSGVAEAFKSAWNATLGGLVIFPGFNPPGPGSIPRVTIPELAGGALLKSQPGGVLFRGAEGGEDEIVAGVGPLEKIVQASVADLVLRGGSAPVAAAPARLTIDLANGTDDLVRLFRKWIANNTTGDVQVALGPRR